ncbi:ATPase family protein associated with various cellular activities (AAA) [Salsuginibacillus halophilus]|uniref:ATPase family protein associated with various cellular activities (AAA) n=1 Tax=Salsuginibacillus halophilus TaxID=517424 RepID=A0A2P8HYI9_9BACI|nr:ATPase family protein associated with various cellular activities (AAA) [Salsuginibacillus halophilus]
MAIPRQPAQARIQVTFNQEEDRHQPETHVLKEHYVLQKLEQRAASLIGLNEWKTVLRQVYAWLHIRKQRQAEGLVQENQTLHMIFTGQPGTGKTTAARMMGELFYDMGALSKGHVIEAERADIVGEYIGQTAQKTRELIKQADGGILFIDEAYALARGGEKDFGKEAVDTLVKTIVTKGPHQCRKG